MQEGLGCSMCTPIPISSICMSKGATASEVSCQLLVTDGGLTFQAEGRTSKVKVVVSAATWAWTKVARSDMECVSAPPVCPGRA